LQNSSSKKPTNGAKWSSFRASSRSNRLGGHDENFSPKAISASRRGRCCTAGCVAGRNGTSLSDAAGAHHCRVCRRGLTDITARLIGQQLSDRLGRQFIVENRPGAGTNVATEAVDNARPDGYTFLLATSSNAINASVYENLNFNFIRDFDPVGSIVDAPHIMEVSPSFPARTVSDFITYAKANSGKINFALAGIGSSSHVTGELFKMMAGVNMIHVPYRGSIPALTDVIGGQVQVTFDPIASSLE
jgi:hypothetical protein